MKQNGTVAETTNEKMHPGIKFMIACGAVTVLFWALKWVYYESGWVMNLKVGIVTAGGVLGVSAGGIALSTYFGMWVKHIRSKRGTNPGFPQKYLYPSGIILLAFGRRDDESYQEMFTRLNPSKNQAGRIQKNADSLFAASLLLGFLIGIIMGFVMYFINPWINSSQLLNIVCKGLCVLASIAILPTGSLICCLIIDPGLENYVKEKV